jgi:hypothetical protein
VLCLLQQRWGINTAPGCLDIFNQGPSLRSDAYFLYRQFPGGASGFEGPMFRHGQLLLVASEWQQVKSKAITLHLQTAVN